MAEINANSLPAKTELGSNDSAIVVDQTSNAGALVDLDVLADKVLDRISSKTFANQVGGSSAATLLAQLSTLNSKFPHLRRFNSSNQTVTVTLPDRQGAFLIVISRRAYDIPNSAPCGLYLAGYYPYSGGQVKCFPIVADSDVSSITTDASTISATFNLGVTQNISAWVLETYTYS